MFCKQKISSDRIANLVIEINFLQMKIGKEENMNNNFVLNNDQQAYIKILILPPSEDIYQIEPQIYLYQKKQELDISVTQSLILQNFSSQLKSNQNRLLFSQISKRISNQQFKNYKKQVENILETNLKTKFNEIKNFFQNQIHSILLKVNQFKNWIIEQMKLLINLSKNFYISQNLQSSQQIEEEKIIEKKPILINTLNFINKKREKTCFYKSHIKKLIEKYSTQQPKQFRKEEEDLKVPIYLEQFLKKMDFIKRNFLNSHQIH